MRAKESVEVTRCDLCGFKCPGPGFGHWVSWLARQDDDRCDKPFRYVDVCPLCVERIDGLRAEKIAIARVEPACDGEAKP